MNSGSELNSLLQLEEPQDGRRKKFNGERITTTAAASTTEPGHRGWIFRWWNSVRAESKFRSTTNRRSLHRTPETPEQREEGIFAQQGVKMKKIMLKKKKTKWKGADRRLGEGFTGVATVEAAAAATSVGASAEPLLLRSHGDCCDDGTADRHTPPRSSVKGKNLRGQRSSSCGCVGRRRRGGRASSAPLINSSADLAASSSVSSVALSQRLKFDSCCCASSQRANNRRNIACDRSRHSKSFSQRRKSFTDNNSARIVVVSSVSSQRSASSRNRSKMIIQTNYIPSKYNIYIAICAANLSALAAGCALTWSSPTLPKLSEPGEKIYITKEEGTWLSSLLALGAAFGPFVACSTVNVLGRKWTLLTDMIIFLLSWTTIAISEDVRFMYFARFLSGIAVGCIFTILPMYIAEVSPVQMRGTLGSLLQFFLCLGFCVSYCIGPFSSFLILILVSAFMPLLCVLLFVWIPESPYYLISKGRKQEAYNALEWFRGYPNKAFVQSEIADIQVSAEESSRKKGSIKSLFSNKGNFKALYYSCALVMFQQMSGVNIVLFYSETIFKATGSSLSPSISTMIIGFVMLSTAALAAPAAKIVGVKNLLIISAIGEGLSTAALGMYFFLLLNREDVSMLGWLPVTSLVLFIIAYSVGFGPFVWVIMAEIFPSHLKAIASAVTASFCWLLCFLLTKFFGTFADTVGIPYAFWIFSGFCILALFFLIIQLPDTQGKSFAEIQEMLHGKKVDLTSEKV